MLKVCTFMFLFDLLRQMELLVQGLQAYEILNSGSCHRSVPRIKRRCVPPIEVSARMRQYVLASPSGRENADVISHFGAARFRNILYSKLCRYTIVIPLLIFSMIAFSILTFDFQIDYFRSNLSIAPTKAVEISHDSEKIRERLTKYCKSLLRLVTFNKIALNNKPEF